MVMDLSFGISIMERDPESKNHLSVSDLLPFRFHFTQEFKWILWGFGGGWREKMLIVHGSPWKGSPARVRVGLGHSWDHPDLGSTLGVAAWEAPQLFHNQEGSSWADDKFLVVFGAGSTYGLWPRAEAAPTLQGTFIISKVAAGLHRSCPN